jgi:23S rRNA pseudouridine1911/1915/1917 synthase
VARRAALGSATRAGRFRAAACARPTARATIELRAPDMPHRPPSSTPAAPRDAPPAADAPSFAWPDAMPRDAVPVVLTVIRERAGMRLDRFLVVEMPRLSRTRAARIAAQFAFTAQGARLSPARIVRAGERIVLFRPAWEEPAAPLERVAVVHADDAIVAVDKPAGLPVHPTARYHRNTLTSVLEQRFPGERIALCHRLDKETSGVLLAARTLAAEASLKRAFAARGVHKVYRAIVHGELDPGGSGELVVDAPLALVGGEVSVLMGVRPAADGGLPSTTRVRVLERLAGYTLVEAAPETGRQHQIRVHLAHVGHAIVGDQLYAHGPGVFLASLRGELDDATRALLGLERHALHAQRITFEHPSTGRSTTLEAPMPDDLEAFVARHRRAPAT